MQEVEAICKRIIIINKGKIVADSDKEKLQESLAELDKQVIFVEFDKTIKHEDLMSIKGITKIKHVKKMQYLIEANATEDIRPLIFNFAVKKGLTVLSLQKKEKSLEEVFHELTR